MPPRELFPPESLDLPPWFDELGAFTILATRPFGMPLSFRASYFFLFFTIDDLFGT